MTLTLISEQVASSDSTLDFTTGIDSTYDVYEFHFHHMHPSSQSQFAFQANASGQSGFNEVMTTTFFDTWRRETTGSGLAYNTGGDQEQATGYQYLSDTVGAGTDESSSGILRIFAPSDTALTTHFVSRLLNYHPSDYAYDHYVGGYFNVAAAIDEISFKFTVGNIQAGTIKLYGVN